MRNQFLLCLFAFSLFARPELQAQSSELAQVVEAPMRRVELPSQNASLQELEAQADSLRGQKDFLDAIF